MALTGTLAGVWGHHGRLAFWFTGSMLAGAIFLALVSGKYPIGITTLPALLLHWPGSDEIPDFLAQPALVLWSVRLPRILFAIIVGAALAVAGVILQAVFRNPLVSPSIVGVTSGANFGAALAMLIGGSALMLQVSAFIWGLLAVGIAYQIGKRGDNNVTTLILAGFIVSALFKAGLSYLKCKADPLGQLPAIVFWTMGSFNGASWRNLTSSGLVIVIGLVLSFLWRFGLNPMALGEEDAMSLGVEVASRRAGFLLIATLMVAAATAVCGDIGWVGLIIPHTARIMVGADHHRLVPFAALLGGLFMLGMDTLARTLPGGEIPVGILTALVGAPCFAFLLLRRRHRSWGDA